METSVCRNPKCANQTDTCNEVYCRIPRKGRKYGFSSSNFHRLSDFPKGMGELIISFLGPPPNDFLTEKALDILGIYLTSSTVSPLNKEYIEIESPLWYICANLCFQKDHLTCPSTAHISNFTTRRSRRTSYWESTLVLFRQGIWTHSMKS